jgi:hypothetical protein
MRTIRAQLSAADADILFLKVTRGVQKPRMGLPEFCDAMGLIAARVSPDGTPKEALKELLGLFAGS